MPEVNAKNTFLFSKQSHVSLPVVEAQVATSLTILGAWIGSLISSGPSQQYGKRLTLLFNAVFFVVGSALSASGNLYALFIGRLISGKTRQVRLSFLGQR